MGLPAGEHKLGVMSVNVDDNYKVSGSKARCMQKGGGGRRGRAAFC